MIEKSYDVFISYRRDKGASIARNLQLALTVLGLKVFFDMEELTDGKFNEKLYEAIERSKNVIFLMTEGALDRCHDDEDWVRKELEYIFDQGVNLIPVAPTGTPLSFPEELPAKLESLKVLEISELNLEKLFKESVAKIAARFKDVEIAGYMDKKEAEETFLNQVRRFKKNDGVIDSEERKSLANSAEILSISPARQLILIERVEKEFEDKDDSAGRNFPPIAVPQTLEETSSRFQVVVGQEVSTKDIEDAVGLDELSYDECYRGNLVDCVEWAKANPDIYVMLRDLQTGHIVAYINVMPVSDECYEKIRCGNFIDVEITPDMILSYDMPQAYCIYFSSVVIHPKYRNSGVFKLLFDAILSRFIQLGNDEVFIKKMLADAVTPTGEKFCKLFGMKKVDMSKHGSTLYEVSMIPPKFRVTSKMTKALHDYYQAKYDEEPYLFE